MIAGILAVTVAAAYAFLLYRGVAAVHVGFGFKLILCASALLPYGELREVAAESVLIAEGQAASGLYFIVRGSVSVRSHDRMGKPIRLRRFTEGTVIGEMSHYLQRPTSAAVVADSALTVLCLSPQAIATLEQNQPQLAIRLHQAVATVLAQRLLATNQSLQAAIA